MDIIRRLACSQARGHRQQSFINELLTFEEVAFTRFTPLYNVDTVLYGESRLSHASWRMLRARLASVGFVITDNPDSMTVKISFPEYKRMP